MQFAHNATVPAMGACEATSGSRPVAAHLALAGTALALATGLCIPTLAELSFLWSTSEFYGHGYAVPLVSALLLYGRRKPLRAALGDLRPPRWGALATLAAAIFEVLMVIGDVGFAAGIGISLLFCATAYALGGALLFRTLLLPLALLTLMVPPPRFLTSEILLRLKLVVTEAAATILQACGWTVVAEGNQILLPHHTLFVADACSGLTSIITLLPLACIVAYFLSRGVWRRLVIVASLVPLAMVANILRVVVTVQLVSLRGIESAQGSLHESFGIATSVLGTLAILGVARLVR